MKSRRSNVVTAVIILVTLMLILIMGIRRWLWNETVYSGLKTIGLALHAYHDDWHSFPPLEWKNDKGTVLSYRVLLMKYFDTAATKEVYSEANNASSVSEIENSTAFQSWSVDAEGRAFLGSAVEFVPVVGDWESWNKPIRLASAKKWNGNAIPMVVALPLRSDSSWCASQKAATCAKESFLYPIEGVDKNVQYLCYDGMVKAGKVRSK